MLDYAYDVCWNTLHVLCSDLKRKRKKKKQQLYGWCILFCREMLEGSLTNVLMGIAALEKFQN